MLLAVILAALFAVRCGLILFCAAPKSKVFDFKLNLGWKGLKLHIRMKRH